MDRYTLVSTILEKKECKGNTILDVGCRDCVLQGHIDRSLHYTGLDFYQNVEKTVGVLNNMEYGLPFKENAFDYVVALDCLEHLNDFQGGVQELIRVAGKATIISLPNMAFISQRINFLFHGRLSTGKYNLQYGNAFAYGDRHRWLTVVPQTDTFMAQLAEDKNLLLDIHHVFESRKREFFARLSSIVGLGPSWWVPSTVYVLQKKE